MFFYEKKIVLLFSMNLHFTTITGKWKNRRADERKDSRTSKKRRPYERTEWRWRNRQENSWRELRKNEQIEDQTDRRENGGQMVQQIGKQFDRDKNRLADERIGSRWKNR